jgi:hypothetical protein
MRFPRHIAAVLVVPSLVIAPWLHGADAHAGPFGSAYQDVPALLQDGSVRVLTARESITLALGEVERGQPDAAIVATNLALGVAKSDREKAALYATLALLYGSKKEYHPAAEAALAGQKHLPNDPRLASLRLVYFELADDGVGALAAKSHLMRLDPNFNRTPVFSVQDVVEVIKALGEIIAIAKTAWAIIPMEQKEEMVEMLDGMLGKAQSLIK